MLTSVVQLWRYLESRSVGNGTANDLPKLQDMEKRTGQAVPSTLRASRQRFAQRKSARPAGKVYSADLELKQDDLAELEILLEVDDVIPEEYEVGGHVTPAGRVKQKTAGMRKGLGFQGQP